MSFILWAAYQKKWSINPLTAYNTYFEKFGAIQDTGTGDDTIDDTTTPAGRPANDIDYTVPAGSRFHLLAVRLHLPVANNDVEMRLKLDGVLKWYYEMCGDCEYFEIILPLRDPIPEGVVVTWSRIQNNAAPARLCRVTFFGIEQAVTQ